MKKAVDQGRSRAKELKDKASEKVEELVDEVRADESIDAESSGERVKSHLASVKKKYEAFIGGLSMRHRLLIIFAIGIIAGFGMKTLAASTITIGYRDYTAGREGAYDLIALQKKVAESGGAGVLAGGMQPAGACAQQ